MITLTKKQEKKYKKTFANKNSMTSLLGMKSIVRSKIFVIMQRNMGQPPIVSVIRDMRYLKKFLQFFVTFSVLIQNGNKNGKSVIYKIKFIDRTRFVWLVHCQLQPIFMPKEYTDINVKILSLALSMLLSKTTHQHLNVQTDTNSMRKSLRRV